MSGFSREQVGVVKSECGVLMVVCPSKTQDSHDMRAKTSQLQDSQAAVRNDAWCGPVSEGLAFAVPIFDGEYPIFATYGKDGELLSIEIDLREDRDRL